jgi:hypothetical protein
LSLVMAGGSLCKIQAQNSLYIKEKSGGQESTALSEVREIHFQGSAMNLVKHDGTSRSYETGDLRFLSFRNYFTGVENPSGGPENTLQLYPNPAKEFFNVKFQGEPGEGTEIGILDLQGKVLKRISMWDRTTPLDVSWLKPGLYICYLKNVSVVLSKKFIKN